ncbi:MAG: universal stress protein [Gammaproteobacteria bacterium]|nr:universal stress protein [Gammaproteobacteria bacterium]
MNSEQRILVVVDPTSEAQPALARAAWLASAHACGLELFICHYDPYLSGERFFDSPGLKKARRQVSDAMLERLARLAEPLAGDGLDVITDVAWDSPLDEGIVRKVLASSPSLVLKDTHYHNALKRSLFSNTDWNLVRSCPAPLWLVKPHDLPEPLRIIAAVDPMHEHDKPAALDHAIIDHAQRITTRCNGELHLFHSYDPSPAIAGAATTIATPISVPASGITEAMQQAHSEALAEFAATYELPEAQVHLLRGPARELLPELAAQQRAGLVVMGAVARGAVRRFFIGSTAEQVLDRLPCDVLIIKPEGFVSNLRVEDGAGKR